jgi:dihydrodipicolinate synthase/N-acetylneuraminate lyase
MPKENLRELIVGPVAPVATPFDEDFEVDLGKQWDLTQWWVESGLTKGNGVIKVAAAAGEGPMLDDHEWASLLRTTVQAADGKATVMCGLHYKDTKRTIRDAKVAQDMGAYALQVCPPIFNDPNQDDMLSYFGELSDVIDIGIMIYHTHWMRHARIEVDTFLRMADFENVVAIKWSPAEGQAYEDMEKFVDRFNIVDNTVSPVRCAQLGGDGFVQTSVEVYPPHDLKVYELIRANKWDEAEALYRKVQGPLREFGSKINQRSGGQGRVTKGLMHVVGEPVGWSRPPSQPLNNEELAELRQIVEGFGWPLPVR